MPIFDGVYYLLSPSLTPARRTDLKSILELNGALPASAKSSRLSHIVTNTPNFDGARDIKEGVKVISDKWVDRSVIMGKLQPEQYYSPDPAMLFSGVVACATDIPGPDLEVLSAGVTALGGQWRQGLTRDVTHLFALHTNSEKYVTATHFRSHTHMILLTPHWFEDSVRLGRVLPTEAYEWPEPRVLLPSHVAPAHDPAETNQDNDAVSRKRKKSSENTEAGTDEGNAVEIGKVWDGRRILLSSSLELSSGHLAAVKAGIRRAGGVVVNAKKSDEGDKDEAAEDEEARLIDESDVLITRFRSGKAYFKAARLLRPILIGTITWLFSVESSGTLSAPTDNLLWYPVPQTGIRGFKDMEITITNYTGVSRDYLKKLITVMGAKFTPSMSASNKVLIAGFTPSPKTDRALAWSIPIVNHTWLEDCFVQWRNLTPALERYINFPPGVDFAKLLNGTMTDGKGTIGGRGVGVIDVDAEQERDRQRGALDREDGTDADEQDKAESGAVPNGLVDKDEEGERNAKKTSKSTAINREAEEPITELGSKAKSKPKSASKSTPKLATGGLPALTKPKVNSAGSMPAGTSTSARDAMEVETEVGLIGRDGDNDEFDLMDVDESPPKEADKPASKHGKPIGTRKAKSHKPIESDDGANSDPENIQPRAAKSKFAISTKSKAHEHNESSEDEHASPRRATPKPKAAPARSRKSLTPPPKKKNARRDVPADSDSDIEFVEDARSKGKHKDKGKRNQDAGDSDTEESDVPQVAKNSAKQKVKATTESNVKPKPKSTHHLMNKASPKARLGQKPALSDEDDGPKSRSIVTTPKAAPKPKAKVNPPPESPSDEEDIYSRPAKSKLATSGSASKPQASSSKTKGKGKSDVNDRSPTRSPSPPPPTKSIKTPKRTVSVLVPPLPEDYFSPGAKNSPASGKSKDLARTHSVRVTAAEASTSSSAKRARPRTSFATPDEEEDVYVPADSPLSARAPSKRGAASRASTKLRNEIMPDVINYEKQVKNSKRRRGSEINQSFMVDDDEDERRIKKKRVDKEKEGEGDKAKGKGKHRTVDESEEEEAEVEEAISPPAKAKQKKNTKAKKPASEDEISVDEDEMAKRKAGKQKSNALEKIAGSQSKKGDASNAKADRDIRMMTTQVNLSDDVLRRLIKLGIKTTTRPGECTHLVAKSIVRTEKFLCALAVAPFILTEEWATGSAKAGKILPEDNYMLSDPDAEKKWKFKFSDALARSKSEGGPRLFAGMTFCITPKVAIDNKLLKNVVTAAGGTVQTASSPTTRSLKGKENRYVISCPDDISIWRPLVQGGFTVYSPELLLTGVLRQEIDWEDKANMITGK